MSKPPQHGILALLMASFLFAIVSVLNRFIPAEIGTFYQLFIKTVIISCLFFIISKLSKSSTGIKPKDWPLFILRGVLFAVDFAAFFVAVNKLPLGTTLFFFYAGSVTASFVYGYFILQERVTTIKVISLSLAVCGLYVIYSNNLNFQNVAGFFAILSGICFGTQTSASKNLSDQYSVNQVNFISYLIATFVSMIFLFISKDPIVPLSLRGWFVFFGFSLVAVFAFYATVYGFKYIEAQKASLLLLGEILFTLVIGYLFYKEVPSSITILGGILIICALALPNMPLLHKKTQ